MKWSGRTAFAIGMAALAGAAIFVVGRVGFSLREAQTASSLPIILDRVQAIGELHTAKQNAETVISVETHREPDGWASGTPIGTLIQATTSNSALVAVKGTVEAGIDLSQARASWKPGVDGKTLLVEVPNVKVYEPVVNGRVHSAKRGFLWKDDNISLKALDEAKMKFKDSARSGSLVRDAEDSARKALEGLLKPLYDGPVEVVFGAVRA
jgi:hypothetical protein